MGEKPPFKSLIRQMLNGLDTEEALDQKIESFMQTIMSPSVVAFEIRVSNQMTSITTFGNGQFKLDEITSAANRNEIPVSLVRTICADIAAEWKAPTPLITTAKARIFTIATVKRLKCASTNLPQTFQSCGCDFCRWEKHAANEAQARVMEREESDDLSSVSSSIDFHT